MLKQADKLYRQPGQSAYDLPCHNESADIRIRSTYHESIVCELQNELAQYIEYKSYDTGGRPLAEIADVAVSVDLPYLADSIPMEVSGECERVPWMAEMVREEGIVIHRSPAESGESYSKTNRWIRVVFEVRQGD